MKKRILTIICTVLCALLVLPFFSTAFADTHYLDINATNFPDANFRQWIIDNLTHSGSASAGYYMTKTQVESVKYIGCSSQSISNLKGIEKFTKLEDLYCSSNSLTSLNVSSNSLLESLVCSSNNLKTLTLGSKPSLDFLSCWDNNLTSLDISKAPKLEYLSCSDNSLTSLNVSANTKLTNLSCDSNSIAKLDISKNTLLETLNCGSNQLTALNVSYAPQLTYLNCYNNLITSLNLSKNTKLTNLDCEKNALTKLDVSKNTLLEDIICDRNQLTTLDVSANNKLETLSCGTNALTTLTIGSKPLLESLSCSSNGLTSLDVTGATALDYLACSNNSISSLNLSKNKKLESLSCYDNKITKLDVSSNTLLKNLYCSTNRLGTLDLSKNTKLEYFSAYSQAPAAKKGASYNGKYQFDMKLLVPMEQMSRVTVSTSGATLNVKTGIVTFSDKATSLRYNFDPKAPNEKLMDVTVSLSYTTQTKPSITTQPAAKSVASGKTATFTVAASGGALTYQWQYSKNNGSTWTNWSGKTSATLSFKGSETNNGYLYRCVVKNLAGSTTSSSAKLTVTSSKPSITTQPAAKTVAKGSTATFKVVASGSGLTYQWYYSKNNGSTWTSWSGKTSATLSFNGSETNNGYLYRCVVKNSGGSVTSSSARLTVTGVKPKILTNPANKTVASGTSITMKVVAGGSGLSYQWQYSKNNGSTWTNWSGKTTSSITFNATSTNNGYQYRCRVKNSYGTVYSSAATLKLK